MDFAKENKKQTQRTKLSVTGNFCSELDLNTAGEKPSLSVFVEIFARRTPISFVGLTRNRNFNFFLLLKYDVSQLSVKLAEGRYTPQSDIISRVFQRYLIQNYKRLMWDFASVNRKFSQFPLQFLNYFRKNKSTVGPGKHEL